MTGGQGRRRKQLLDDAKETRGYQKLKTEAPHRTLWKRLWICRKIDNGMNSINRLVFVAEAEGVYCAVRMESLNKTKAVKRYSVTFNCAGRGHSTRS